MNFAILAILLANLPAAPAAADPYEDYILQVYASTAAPAGMESIVRTIVENLTRKRILERARARLSGARTTPTALSLAPAAQPPIPAATANDFKLRSIYAFPNPAVAGQKPIIHVSVGVADKVTFRFYDISGQQVHQATIDSPPSQIDDGTGPHPAYEYAWEGRIPSGVYLYSVTAEKAGQAPIRQTGKFAVVR